jgi:uncharacterized protein with von Willebrand factor type A (vWA) domain
MKTLHTLILILAFEALTCHVSSVRAQQVEDDPNWRERRLERMKKEVLELEKKLEVLNKEFEELREKLEMQRNESLGSWGPLLNQGLQNKPRSRWLDRWDYGPMFPQYRSNLFPHP